MHLYNDVCDFSKKPILSAYSGVCDFPVYERDIWWSDVWSAHDYALDFDFSRSFFDQFRILQDRVPRMSLHTSSNNENCPYVNNASANKNCHLVFGVNFSENCYYGWRIFKSKSCLDSLNIGSCELCYNCVDCFDCYSVSFSQDCNDCRESPFLYDCRNCNNCICCTGLRNKSFCINNKQYSQEEFQKIRTSPDFWSHMDHLK